MRQVLKDFLKGMGQAFDLGAALAPEPNSDDRKSQAQAINGYWRNIGKHMSSAVSQSVAPVARKTDTKSDD